MSKIEVAFRHPASQVLAVTVTAISIPSAIQYFTDTLQFSISRIVIVPLADGLSLPAGNYAVAALSVTFVMFILIGLICTIAIHVLFLRRIRSAEVASYDELHESYNKLCDSMQNVVQHIYNPSQPNTEPDPRHAFKKIFVECEINARGDAKVTQQYQIEAGPEAVHFFKMNLILDGMEQAINTLDDIAFQVVSQTPDTSLDYFPTDFRGHRRDIAIFFLPELRPGESRAFKIDFAIKGWFGELFSSKKSTNFPWANRTLHHTNAAEVLLKFIFDKECGQVELVNKRRALTGDQITRRLDGYKTVWTYENVAADIRRLDWMFLFRKLA